MEESNTVPVTNNNAEHSKLSTKFCVRFLGSMCMNRLYSQTMQPWVMSEIHRQKKCIREVVFEVVGEAICVSSKEVGHEGNPLLFEHSLRHVSRFAKLHQDPKCFGYLTRELLDDDFVCHVYLADCEDVIQQVFQALREASRGITAKPGPGDTTSQPVIDSNSPIVDGGDPDSSKPLYEVKFVGRVKVGGKKVTSDDIDRLAEKIIAELEKRELDKIKQEEEVLEARRRRHASEASIGSFSDTMDDADEELTSIKTETHKDTLETAEFASSHGGCNTEGMLVDRLADVEGSRRGSVPSGSDLSLKGEEDSKCKSDQLASLQKALQAVSFPSRDNLSSSVEQDLNNPDLRVFQRGLHSFSLTGSRSRHSSASESRRGSIQEPIFGRQRNDSSSSHDSGSSAHARHEVGQAMVLKIGQQEVTLINLDKKMVFLEFKFKDISSVSQGSRRQDMFGIVARESESRFICYLLRCLSGSVVAEIMSTLQMAFAAAYNKRGTPTSTATTATAAATATHHQVCTSCPLYQLHRICQEINAMPSQAAYDLLVKKVQLLPDHELNELNSLMQVEEPESFEESVEVMISFLRHLCERKQREHIHISEMSKAGKAGVNILEDKHNIFEGLRSKAKKSFTASFENLLNRNEIGRCLDSTAPSVALQRGKKKEDGCRTVGWTTDSDTSYASRESSITSTPEVSPMNKDFPHSFPSPPSSPGTFRKRSATFESLSSSPQSDVQLARRRDVNHNKTSSPVRNVILSTINSSQESSSSSCVSSPQENSTVLSSLRRPSSSWRKAIFNRVCTPQHSGDYGDDEQPVGKVHDPEEIRSMWKKAFLETLLLIRLEKECHSIRARQEEEGTTLCRKLDYQELTPCLKEITAKWEKMLSSQDQDVDEDGEEKQAVGTERTVSHVKLLEYVKKGVPRSLRGQIWLFLIQQQQQQQMYGSVPDCSFGDANYDDLLKQLTTHQHAILIDLGRTFPNHPYFSTPLGPGQLELFNLLKAYSLLDAEVGYCQGLSFIVGMLLMHMEEISAFHVLKYMMYGLGLRKQFRPNMTALQVFLFAVCVVLLLLSTVPVMLLKLYQLTRLLHDHYKDVYDHFEAHEISPTLYAAPWFLTLFASQFPLGFVSRVFDMIFVQGIDALFKLALMLIGNHRALILQCDTFESIVDFLKITLPEMVQVQMERIINQAFELDIERELRAYEVEYYVLSEELTFSTHRLQRQQQMQKQDTSTTNEARFPRIEKRRMSIDLEMLYRLENQNRALKNQNQELVEKLQQVETHRESLEESVLAHQVERDKLRSHIQALELERAALLTAVSKLQKLVPQESLQQVNLCPAADLPSSSSHSAPASSKRASTGPAVCPGHAGRTTLTAASSELETASGELKDLSQAASVNSMLPSVPVGESIAEDSPAPALAADARTESVSPDPPISVFSDKDTKSADVTEASAVPVFTDKDMQPESTCKDSVPSVLTSHAAAVSSLHKPGVVLSLPTLNFGATEARSSSKPLNDFQTSDVASNPAQIPADATLSSSSILSSSCVGEEEKNSDDQNAREEAASGQSLPWTDLQHPTSTTVSSIRQLYPSRSISNIPSNHPAVGSVTPEERRRAVKVVVQHSTVTRNIQQSPSSQR